MPINADLAYEIAVECCGRTFHVARTLGLVRRVESAFGACDGLAHRLDRHQVTLGELAYLIDIMLSDVSSAFGRPKRDEIEAWLFEAGIHRPSKKLGGEVMTLIMGNDVLADVIAKKRAPTQQKEPVRGPFVPTVASSGPTG